MDKLKWLIWSIEHSAWWRPNWNGYTTKKEEAGRYEFHEARSIVFGANRYKGDTPYEAMIIDEEVENA